MRKSRPVLVCCAAAILAGFLTFGDMVRLVHADVLIPTFVSLYRWTWFYWGQDRYGMLTALLAMPIRHPLLNLLFQNWMTCFCGMMVFALAPAYLIGWRSAPLVGLISAGVFLLFGSEAFHQDYLLASQPYAVSTCLGLLGLLVADGSSGTRLSFFLHKLFAFILFFLCGWVSVATPVLIAPLVVARWYLGTPRDKKRAWTGLQTLLLIGGAGVMNGAIALASPYRNTSFTLTPAATWSGNVATILRNTYQAVRPTFVIAQLGLIGVGALVWMVVPAARRRGGFRHVQVAGAMVVASMVYLLFIATMSHAQESGFGHRYAMPSIPLSICGAAMFVTMLVMDPLSRRWHRVLEVALLVVLLTGVTLRYGVPSYGHARRIIDEKFGSRTVAILDNHCTHVIGSYWEVWPSVFHANLVLYESGSNKTVWGIADRSKVTQDLWYPLLQGGRVAVLRDAESARVWRSLAWQYQLPELELVGETKEIRIFAPLAGSSAPTPQQ